MTASMPAALGPFPFELFPAAICIDSTKTNPDPKRNTTSSFATAKIV
jgi:hypothetical protein